MARVTAVSLSQRLAQPVVVEDLPGAAGIIGTQAVVRATSDGYTLLFSGVDGFDILPALVKKMPYDPAKDLIPIAKLTQVDVVLAVNSKVPANNIKELLALAKQKPGELKFASTGLGTMNHMAGELINVLAGEIVAQLEQRKIKSAMSLPTVTRGSPLEFLPEAGPSIMHVAYKSREGPFWFRFVAAKHFGSRLSGG
jgi:tripartite-type tricarboxylate transporter receptor subunit TctC